MTIFAKWIPVGHAESKFDATGKLKAKDADAEKKPVDYKAQQKGQDGTLEVYPIEYTHPSIIKNPSKFYYVSMQLG